MNKFKEHLSYDEGTGALRWTQPRQRRNIKERADRLRQDGYREVSLDREHYLAHRVIWLLKTGAWPRYEIDHINRDKADNRFINLRDVRPSINKHNQGKQSNKNSQLPRGIEYRDNRYRVRLQVNGKRIDKTTITLEGAMALLENLRSKYL